MSLSPQTQDRLDKLRGNLPRRTPNVRVLADFSQNTDCSLATLGFVAGMDFGHLLRKTRYQAAFSHSPFAVLRGNTFEEMLREKDYARTLTLIREPLGLPAKGVRVVNLRTEFPAETDRMARRLQKTNDLLREIIQGKPSAARWIDGAVLQGTVGGVSAFFEADALGAGTSGEIRIAEVKSFPKVDDRVDPDQLGSALDQSAVYVMLARETVAKLGGDPMKRVSDRVMLITPRNVGLTPTLSEQRVTARIKRIERVFAGIPEADHVVAATPADVSFAPVADTKNDETVRLKALHAIADRVGTSYTSGCLASCANARFCRERAIRAESPCVTGTAAVRLLPEVLTLGRAESLTRGAKPSRAETPAAILLEQAGRLIDEAASIPTPNTQRTT